MASALSALVLAGVVPPHATAAESANTRFSVQVVEEEGAAPVRGTKIIATFKTAPGGLMERAQRVHLEERTDAAGIASFEHRSIGSWGASIVEKGFYRCGLTPEESRASGIEKGLLQDRWQPWDTTYQIVARRKLNPVPMVVRRNRDMNALTVPVLGQSVGYDLIVGDWVVPHGLGTRSDLLFFMERSGSSYDQFSVRLKLSFSNEGDGIQKVILPSLEESPCEFRWPRMAPDAGYLPSLEKFYVRKAPGAESEDNVDHAANYFIRIRTQLDEAGLVKEGVYGKLVGDFQLDWQGHIGFHYYVNPDKSRNMEFDPSKNLVKGSTDVFEP